MPELTPSISTLGKMALGALSGFEYVALLAGETKVRRARSAVGDHRLADHRAHVHPRHEHGRGARSEDQIDLVSPIPQTLTIAFRGLGVASLIAPLLIGLLLLRQIGTLD